MHRDEVEGVGQCLGGHDDGVFGGMAEHEAQQPFLDKFLFQQHLCGIHLGEHKQSKVLRGGVCRRDQFVQKRHFLVGQVEIEISVGVFQGEDEILFVCQSVEVKVALLVSLGDVVGDGTHRQRVEVVAVSGIK